MTATVPWEAVVRRRLQRHALTSPLLTGTPASTIPAAASAMVGAHAQVMAAAEVAIGLRTDGVTRAEVAAALWDDRSLVKTFGPRGTVHLLPAAELDRWLGALSAVPSATGPAPHRLTAPQTAEVLAVLDELLRGGEFTVEELDQVVAARCGEWSAEPVMPMFGGFAPRWRFAISGAAYTGVLCFGPNRGRRVTYTSPHRWLASVSPADAGTALVWLVERYLYSYGPATPASFARWSAAPERWARELFQQMGERVEPVRIAGTAVDAVVLLGDTVFADPEAPAVRLLPYFDPYVIGGQPRDLVFSPTAAARALYGGHAGGQAGVFPILLVDGQVAGVWHARRSGKRITITVESLAPLTARHRAAVAVEADRVASVLEATATLQFGTISVGPHS